MQICTHSTGHPLRLHRVAATELAIFGTVGSHQSSATQHYMQLSATPTAFSPVSLVGNHHVPHTLTWLRKQNKKDSKGLIKQIKKRCLKKKESVTSSSISKICLTIHEQSIRSQDFIAACVQTHVHTTLHSRSQIILSFVYRKVRRRVGR